MLNKYIVIQTKKKYYSYLFWKSIVDTSYDTNKSGNIIISYFDST